MPIQNIPAASGDVDLTQIEQNISELQGQYSALEQSVTANSNSISGINSALPNKSDTDHNHAGVYEPANENIQSHIIDTIIHVTSGDKTNWNSKAEGVHTHVKANITDFAHTHLIADLPVATSGTSNTTQVVRADDSRLSDARTPTSHTHTKSEITDFAHNHAISDITNLQTALDGKEKAFSTATASSLTIDLATAKYFFVTLSANASFTLSNVTTGTWTFHILNEDDAAIDIAIPNGANNIFQAATLSIGAGAVAEISLVSDGTKRVWLLSNELTVGA